MQPQLYHLLQSSKLPLEATSAQELSARSFMKWVSMAKQLKITKWHAKIQLEGYKAHYHWTLEQRKPVL